MVLDSRYSQFLRETKLKTAFTFATSISVNATLAAYLYSNAVNSVNVTPETSPNLLFGYGLFGGFALGLSALALMKAERDQGEISFSKNISSEDRILVQTMAKRSGCEYEGSVYYNGNEYHAHQAATDGVDITFNEYYWKQASKNIREFINCHEYSHIINDDTRFSLAWMLATTVPTGMLTGLAISHFDVSSLTASCLAISSQFLLRKKLSRVIEQRADVEGAVLSGGIDKALECKNFKFDQPVTVKSSLKSLMNGFYLSRKVAGLFRTHPTPERSHVTIQRVLG